MEHKQTMTKADLDAVTSKWIDEQDPETFNNPILRVAVNDDGGEYDAQAEAQKWAKNLPDKDPEAFNYGFIARTSN